MNQKPYLLLLLLVIISWEYAHADIELYSHHLKANGTTGKTLSATSKMLLNSPVEKGRKNNLIKNAKNLEIKKSDGVMLENENDIPGAFSVVQDWHLVCKQLCGAGLGGPTCGEPQCEDIKASQTENVTAKGKKLLSTNKDSICKDLCKYQLGGDICDCHVSFSFINSDRQESVMWDRNQVCYTFCFYNDITLTGCSLCTKESPTPGNSTAATEKVTTKLTTPNWKEICEELCKRGDGGALCNCDKPPFF